MQKTNHNQKKPEQKKESGICISGKTHDPEEIRFFWTEGIEQNPDAVCIRKKVFQEEQGFQDEFDETDKTAWQLVIYQNDCPAGTARLYELSSEEGKGSVYAIGRIALYIRYRGLHLGEVIVLEAERRAKMLAADVIFISAQVRIKDFYRKLGYREEGDSYMDESCPHVAMEKYLR